MSFYIKCGQLIKRAKFSDGKIILYLSTQEKGSEPYYVEGIGYIKGVFKQTLPLSKVDDCFSRTISAGVQIGYTAETEFELYNGDIYKQDVDDNRITLYTDKLHLINRFDFEVIDKKVGIKKVSFAFVNYLRIVTESVKFHTRKETIVKAKDIPQWLQQNVMDVK